MQPPDRPLRLNVNASEYKLVLEPRRTLLDALRDDLHLTGTKKVCDMGDCGACLNILRAGRLVAGLSAEAEGEHHADPTHR